MPKNSSAQKDDDIRFEAAFAELENILQRMSGQDVALDESLKLYARAAELIAVCGGQLKQAREEVEAIGARLEEIGETYGV